MIYQCDTCGKEYTVKPNAQNHAEKSGHLNFTKIKE